MVGLVICALAVEVGISHSIIIHSYNAKRHMLVYQGFVLARQTFNRPEPLVELVIGIPLVSGVSRGIVEPFS